MHLTLAESQELDIMKESEREMPCYPGPWPPALPPCSPSCLGVTVDTLSRPPLKLLGIWLKCKFPLINPLSMCVWQCVHLHAVVCSQQCMYGPVCPCVCVKKLVWPPRGWDGGMVGARCVVMWQHWGRAGPVRAAPSVALLFFHYLTFDCL